MPIVRTEFKRQRVSRGDAVVYCTERRLVLVEDEKERFAIRPGAPIQDGLHRWARFRDFVFRGGWSSAKEVATEAREKYGHSVTPWLGDSPEGLVEFSGQTWAEAQRRTRERRANGKIQ